MDENTLALNYIRQHFNWDDPKLPNMFQHLSGQAISPEDICKVLGITKEEFDFNIAQRPMLRFAMDMGPVFADAAVINKLYETALSGNVSAQQFWLKNRRKSDWGDKLNIEVTGRIDLQAVLDQARRRATEGVIDAEFNTETGNGDHESLVGPEDQGRPLSIRDDSIPLGATQHAVSEVQRTTEVAS